jgi:hypothetical protein
MNVKRFIPACVVVFVFIFFFEWLFHGVILAGIYAWTPQLWRTEEAMLGLFQWLVIGQILFSIMISFIFVKGYEDRGIGEGVRYGIIMGLLFMAPNLIMYAVVPYPKRLIAYWIVGGFVEMIIAGIILAAIYRPPCSCKEA